MKTRVFVGFNEGKKSFPRIQQLLGRIDCLEGLADENDFLCGLYQHAFDSEDERLGQLRLLLESEGIKWSERIEHKYTDSELRDFPLLDLTVDRKPLDAGGTELGTTFDLSWACPECGTGAIQTSPLLLPLGGLPKTGLLCEAAYGEILVGGPLAQALQDAEVTGLELRQTRFYRNDEPLPWWQMISSYEMPPMHADSRGIIVSRALPPCPVCSRDGHYHTLEEPSQIAYQRTGLNLEEMPDVVHTWERFGRSGIDKVNPQFSRYAPPLILIKPKIFDIFRKLKVRYARFGPVRLVG